MQGLSRVVNARVGPNHSISQKTIAVSNCFVLYIIAYNRQHKIFIQFINIQNNVREKYLIKLFILYGYEYITPNRTRGQWAALV